MKKSLLVLCLLSFLFPSISYAVPTTQGGQKNQKATVVTAKDFKKAKKLEAKIAKKKERITKKIQKKLAKKGINAAEASNVWNDDNFKLGALIALGGLLLTILGVLPILGGIFSLIGGLMMIVGVGLMIWVLIENS